MCLLKLLPGKITKNPKHTVATVLKKKGTKSVSVYLLMVKLYISRAVVRRVR